MATERELLVESRDSWQESANHDRKQFLGSFAIVATGLTVAGIGIGTMLGGNAGGAFEFVLGGGLAVAYGRIGIGEVQDFAEMTAQTAIRQSQINELTEPNI